MKYLILGMKEFLEPFMVIVVFCYTVVFVLATLGYVMKGSRKCNIEYTKYNRFDYIVPAKPMVCWLKEEVK